MEQIKAQDQTAHSVERSSGNAAAQTRAEFIADAMADGVTTLGTAMALADAAGKRNGYRLTHEQVHAVTIALAAARIALAHEGSAAAVIRADALDKVNAACAAIAKASGSAS